MDKKLIFSALLAFLVSLTLLLADLGLISVPYLSPAGELDSGQALGTVRQVQRQVRRRAHNRVIWQASDAQDPLFAQDSILTLQQSAALLELNNNTQLRLQENTLVVLEPLESLDRQAKDSSFRLRFFRGHLRTQKTTQAFRLSAGEWSLDVEAGADLSLRGQGASDNFEVEVAKGEVKIFHSSDPTAIQQVPKGSRLFLNEEMISTLERIDPQLSWSPSLFPSLEHRIYSHSWPVSVELRWQGMAEKLRHSQPSSEAAPSIHTVLGRQAVTLNLGPGSHHFQLLGLDSQNYEVTPTSPTLSVHLWQAPRLRHLSPLPRDRFQQGQAITFSWLSLGAGFEYYLKITDPESSQVGERATVLLPTQGQTVHTAPLAQSGLFYWSVVAKDEDGFEIPAFLTYPIYSLPDPLSAPKLRAPARAPSSGPPPPEPQSMRTGPSIKQRLFAAILPRVHAAETEDLQTTQFLLSWFEVEGADHYYLEISEDPQFESPVVTKRIQNPEYLWSTSSQNVHYYRVAAGSADGRMGVFSEVMRVDPGALQADSMDEPMKEIAETAPTISDSVSSPPEESAPEVPLVSAPPKEIARTEEKVSEPDRLLPHETRVVLEFWYAPVHRLGRQSSSSQIFDASSSGSSSSSAGLRLSIPQHGRASWHFALSADQHFWTLKDPSTSPAQMDLKDQQIKWTTLRRGLYSRWGFGVSALQWNQLERADLESLVLKEISALGPSVERERYYLDRRIQLRQSASLLLGGNSLWATDAQLRALYLWQLPQDSQLSLGLQLDALLWRNSSTKGSQVKSLFVLGWMW